MSYIATQEQYISLTYACLVRNLFSVSRNTGQPLSCYLQAKNNIWNSLSW